MGFVGGVDEEVIWEFAAGFAAGVEATDPDAVVLTEYLAEPPAFGDGYENAPAGESAARRMYTAGADVVFAAAGTSGLGVFEAAADVTAETGLYRWAIGVDTDQYETISVLPLSVHPGRWKPHILTSVMKHSDVVIRDAVIAFGDRDLEPGTQLVGLAEGTGGLSYSGGFLDAHREELERVREQIVAGEIDVPCRPADRLGQSTPSARTPASDGTHRPTGRNRVPIGQDGAAVSGAHTIRTLRRPLSTVAAPDNRRSAAPTDGLIRRAIRTRSVAVVGSVDHPPFLRSVRLHDEQVAHLR